MGRKPNLFGQLLRLTNEKIEEVLKMETKIIEAVRQRKSIVMNLALEYAQQNGQVGTFFELYEIGQEQHPRLTKVGWDYIYSLRDQYLEKALQITSAEELVASYAGDKNPLPELRKKWQHGLVIFALGVGGTVHGGDILTTDGVVIPELSAGEVEIAADCHGNLFVFLGPDKDEDDYQDEDEEWEEEYPSEVTVYVSDKDDLSFRTSDDWEHEFSKQVSVSGDSFTAPFERYEALWDFHDGLSMFSIADARKINVPEKANYLLVRLHTGKINDVLPKGIIHERDSFRSGLAEEGKLTLINIIYEDVEINPGRFSDLLDHLQKNGIEEIGYVYAVFVEMRVWRKHKTYRAPITISEVKAGHALHYPQDGYINLGTADKAIYYGIDTSVISWSLDELDRIEVLLYPDGTVLLTNGVAGNPTYWAQVVEK